MSNDVTRILLQSLQWPVWLVVTLAVMGWLTRSLDKRTRGNLPDNALYYPRAILVLGMACMGFFAGVGCLAYLFPGVDGSGHRIDHVSPWIFVCFFGFACMGLYMVVSYYFEMFFLEPEGLRYRTLYKKGMLYWGEIASVHYSQSMKWFVMKTHDGRTVRVSAMLTGLRQFSTALTAKLAPSVFDDDARLLFDAMERGYRPSVWE